MRVGVMAAVLVVVVVVVLVFVAVVVVDEFCEYDSCMVVKNEDGRFGCCLPFKLASVISLCWWLIRQWHLDESLN